MANLANNPARALLLTAMAESNDNGAKVWDEQPATRNSTKQALLQSGYVKITNTKAAITAEGRAALTKLSLDDLAAKWPKEVAKAKFEAARAEVVKPAKPANAKPTKKALTAALQSDEFAKAVSAQPAANPPEQKTEPVKEEPVEGEQEVEDFRPASEVLGGPVKPTFTPAYQPGQGYLLAAILRDIYGVGLADAPALAVIWAASQLADIEGVETAKNELAQVNKFREQAGVVPAYPPYGSKLF